MKKIEHIGIAVKNLNDANLIYSKIFNQEPYKTESVESEAVSTSFFMVGENKIELLEATNPDSAIAKFIEKKVKAFIILLLMWKTFMLKCLV